MLPVNPAFDWQRTFGLDQVAPPAELTPENATAWNEAQQRKRIAQALLQQATAPGGAPTQRGRIASATSPLQPFAQMAQAVAGSRMAERAQEDATNLRMGLKPISPAFDDAGYAMPRAPGMAQPSGWDELWNWYRTVGS